jgi:hypothetical protein
MDSYPLPSRFRYRTSLRWLLLTYSPNHPCRMFWAPFPISWQMFPKLVAFPTQKQVTTQFWVSIFCLSLDFGQQLNAARRLKSSEKPTFRKYDYLLRTSRLPPLLLLMVFDYFVWLGPEKTLRGVKLFDSKLVKSWPVSIRKDNFCVSSSEMKIFLTAYLGRNMNA